MDRVHWWEVLQWAISIAQPILHFFHWCISHQLIVGVLREGQMPKMETYVPAYWDHPHWQRHPCAWAKYVCTWRPSIMNTIGTSQPMPVICLGQSLYTHGPTIYASEGHPSWIQDVCHGRCQQYALVNHSICMGRLCMYVKAIHHE